MIRLDNIGKKYNTNLFQELSFTFNLSKIFLITGDMGSGKSTLVKMLAGLVNPTSGEIIHGYKSKEFIYSESRLFLYQNVSVQANMKFYKDLFKTPEEHYLKICKLLKLNEIKKIKVSKLSDGNRKKVSLACSLLNNNARVYLLDEPFVNLDHATIKALISYLQSIKNDKIIIIVSHQYEDIKKYVDTQLILENGSILEK